MKNVNKNPNISRLFRRFSMFSSNINDRNNNVPLPNSRQICLLCKIWIFGCSSSIIFQFYETSVVILQPKIALYTFPMRTNWECSSKRIFASSKQRHTGFTWQMLNECKNDVRKIDDGANIQSSQHNNIHNNNDKKKKKIDLSYCAWNSFKCIHTHHKCQMQSVVCMQTRLLQ